MSTIKIEHKSTMDSPSLIVNVRWFPTKVTPVFYTYWEFAAERQNIFFRRLQNSSPPYTDDQILKTYKFTNAYRASDRVSQYLIRNVIYQGSQEPQEVFFRIILFKIFNKINTWELFLDKFKEITFRDYAFERYNDTLLDAMANRISVFSSAYIMPTRSGFLNAYRKHANYLKIIELMMKGNLPAKICDANSLQKVFELLRSYPLIGDFLAYQYTIDINYSHLTDFSEMTFVMPGPGALNGIQKCFSDYGGLSPIDLIKFMADKQEEEFERLGLKFQTLWGRRLQLIDCQNIFCEVDKYSRVRYPELSSKSGRKRIKHKFKPNPKEIDYFYPPKWEINHLIKQ